MKFRPLHDRVVVRRVEEDTKTKGGIIIPDTAQEKPMQGEIIAVGPGGRDEAGKLIPIDVKAGDTVRVHFQVIEGQRRRVQVFEGIVIKRQGSTSRETFTVRKQSFGVGVERTFPVHSPKIDKIERITEGAVRRAKLYYLRDKVGKKARVREKQR